MGVPELDADTFRRRLIAALERLEGTDEARLVRAVALVLRVLVGPR
jgi:hypothetical protein